MTAILITIGLLSVYFGYRLFCSTSRRTIGTVAGAMLAIFGMTILVGEAKGLARHKVHAAPGIHRSPDWQNGAAPSSHRRPHVEFIA